MSFAGTLTWNGLAGFDLPVRRPVRDPDRAPSVAPDRIPAASPSGQRSASCEPGKQARESAGQARREPDASPARAPRDTARAATGYEERRLEADWSLIVARCMHGDSGAWAELVKAHHRRVYTLCYRFTGSPHDSEDLTQEVFLKVYSNLTNFDAARGSFPTWLTTLTRNLLVDHFRRSRQQRVTDSIDAGWEDCEEQSIVERLADTQRSPHELAASKEIERMVQEALTRVSPELREAVILRDLQDLDYKEIAQVLRIPEGTVKSRISRGRAELARLLERSKGQVV
ncbi:MAG TPA: sigma-70 family RNA polymerase sigma factor [Acidisarcina sp.]